MGLLDLPAELRLRIYDYLPELCPDRQGSVAPNFNTPAVCRASRQLHNETLPIYAGNSHFEIEIDESMNDQASRMTSWLRALGPLGVGHVRSLQLNCHWDIRQPIRWQGHVGFYIRLVKANDAWQCTAGTYPFARDTRDMRLQSVELVQHVVKQEVLQPIATRDKQALRCSDVELAVAAMGIVASHPISTSDTEQGELGRTRRREIWLDMEGQLFALNADKSPGAGGR
ncbi:hypothetical protein LTR36_005901 [Oleoguttula mirabilis]|uniref:F-box domain-containing protein n=1 Tax=Oleoguttula mirabilis TaxID=1507867 RepID=A0AAV9JF60_9PEZI|nr:hypothetical protein LTR36_005901 [Oleoguttula mirabilis]